ncbi:helix-turn-helix domain-containing protein [Nocardia sp. MW-W600-9]
MTEALRLFGEQGFAKTSIAQIEQAAGLSGGSGALYRHFKSKDELLVRAVASRLEDRGEWERFMAPEFSIAAALDSITARRRPRRQARRAVPDRPGATRPRPRRDPDPVAGQLDPRRAARSVPAAGVRGGDGRGHPRTERTRR